MMTLSNDDVGSSVDVAVCSCFSCCALRRFLKSSSLISLSSSTSVLPLRRTSRTYASASSASRLLSLTFLARSFDWSASSSSRSVSTIQLTEAPSVRCTARSWAASRSTSKRVRGSHGGRSSGGRSSMSGYAEYAAPCAGGTRTRFAVRSGRFLYHRKIVSYRVKETCKVYLYFRHSVHERFVDAQCFSTVQQALRKLGQI